MPTQLYNNAAISFICARNFVYNGVEHEIGTDFDQGIDPGRLDMLVRTRRIIPVIDDYDDKPRHWYREVQLRANVVKKLGYGDYMAHPETKVWKDEETHKVGRQGAVTQVGGPIEEPEEEELFDPAEHTVVEVLDYLDSDIDDDERLRVLKAEEDGKDRKGITNNG